MCFQGFTKDSLGVMIMGQFDPLDCKFDMLTDGWHLLNVIAPQVHKQFASNSQAICCKLLVLPPIFF